MSEKGFPGEAPSQAPKAETTKSVEAVESQQQSRERLFLQLLAGMGVFDADPVESVAGLPSEYQTATPGGALQNQERRRVLIQEDGSQITLGLAGLQAHFHVEGLTCVHVQVEAGKARIIKDSRHTEHIETHRAVLEEKLQQLLAMVGNPEVSGEL
ncbi:MAG: hypothetical protein HOE53_03305 [Candidatus Magasanikbacteria bacterium]|jgi:hypothetical protein|nr:hypothetical protein [Candidatus Magasanikbacteria bacterium]